MCPADGYMHGKEEVLLVSGVVNILVVVGLSDVLPVLDTILMSSH